MEPEIVRSAAQYPAVLVTGARQTGKTSLLRHAFPDAHYISLDLPSIAAAAESEPSSLLDAPDRNGRPVLIDEVQNAPRLFRHLKLRIDQDRHRNGRFLLTGSQAFPLMKEVSESLAGRIAILHLGSLSGPEILAHPDLAGTSAEELLWRGGFPELYRNRTLHPPEFLAYYTATYLERDLRAQLRVGSLRDFERFLRAAAIRSGRLLNLTEIARDTGIAPSTAREWLSALEASRQVFLLEPYFANLTKRMTKTPKLYFRDTGLLCYLLGFDDPAGLLRSAHLGAVWETFVANQLSHACSPAGHLFFLRDAYGLEVDFVLERNGKCGLAECKWTETPDRRDAANIAKARALLGEAATGPHWIAARPAMTFVADEALGVKAVDACRFRGWWDEPA